MQQKINGMFLTKFIDCFNTFQINCWSIWYWQRKGWDGLYILLGFFLLLVTNVWMKIAMFWRHYNGLLSKENWFCLYVKNVTHKSYTPYIKILRNFLTSKVIVFKFFEIKPARVVHILVTCILILMQTVKAYKGLKPQNGKRPFFFCNCPYKDRRCCRFHLKYYFLNIYFFINRSVLFKHPQPNKHFSLLFSNHKTERDFFFDDEQNRSLLMALLFYF